VSGVAEMTCECGCSVSLHLDDDDEPSWWMVLDPSCPPPPLPDEYIATASRGLAAQAAFEPTIRCVCGRTYRALNEDPWIVEETA
jgi:hypothetical protein